MPLTVIPLARQKLKLAKRFEKGDTTFRTVGRFEVQSTGSYQIGKQFLAFSPGSSGVEGGYVDITADPTAVSGLTNVYEYTISVRGLDSDSNAIPPTSYDAAREKDHEEGATVAIVVDPSLYKEMFDELEQTINDKTLMFRAFGKTTDITVGDYRERFPVPKKFNNHSLTRVYMLVDTAGTTGSTTIQIHNLTSGVDVLSTPITIASGADSDTTDAGGTAVINASNDDVSTNTQYRLDVDTVSTTAPQGLFVVLEFTAN